MTSSVLSHFFLEAWRITFGRISFRASFTARLTISFSSSGVVSMIFIVQLGFVNHLILVLNCKSERSSTPFAVRNYNKTFPIECNREHKGTLINIRIKEPRERVNIFNYIQQKTESNDFTKRKI
jgi:hypothetical protein